MTVVTGLDLLIRRPKSLIGRKIGIITNQSGVTRTLVDTVTALVQLPGVDVRALFGPEHGIHGAAHDGVSVDQTRDPGTGLPVFSLYGPKLQPSLQDLANIDLLLFDIQDVGCRFYTYITTLSYAMEAATSLGIQLVVLDRPNPIGGLVVEGPLLAPGISSFVGKHPIPPRHGFTIGEFARWLQGEYLPSCDLQVVPMRGWLRSMYWQDTGLDWVAPSPNMPTPDTAVVYPGMCLIEGTNVSEGRGTAHPFEIVGAPWVDGRALAIDLNQRQLSGVIFRPTMFTPTYGKHRDQMCEGIQVHVVNRRTFKAFETGLHVIDALHRRHHQTFAFLPSSWEGARPHFDLLTGDQAIRASLLNGQPVHDLAAAWKNEERRFAKRRSKYLLYD